MARVGAACTMMPSAAEAVVASVPRADPSDDWTAAGFLLGGRGDGRGDHDRARRHLDGHERHVDSGRRGNRSRDRRGVRVVAWVAARRQREDDGRLAIGQKVVRPALKLALSIALTGVAAAQN